VDGVGTVGYDGMIRGECRNSMMVLEPGFDGMIRSECRNSMMVL